jgi:hypothetical protein
MMKMVSWLNCERFQIKTNWKRHKFLGRGNLFLSGSQPALPLGVHMVWVSTNPALLSDPQHNGFQMVRLWQKGSQSALPLGVQMV